ncbi:hypothetical protein Tco_1114367 [Tanacetum coccineum]|uniref:Uncharacterized protein n=1 Tax=Tanacetum coccineum TaxID=301880 RepID=A0ABQ5IUY3_9ASTR
MRGIIVDRNAKFDAFQKEFQTLKLQLYANIEDNKSLTTKIDVLKKDISKKQEKYIEEIVDLEKKRKALDNIVYKTIQTMHIHPLYLYKAQQIQPVLYSSSALVEKHASIFVIDTEETFMLAEESRLKILAKQNNKIMKEKKVNITPIDYTSLNRLSEHFLVHFVPKKQLKYFDIEKKELLIENDCLLEQIISQDIMCIAMHSYDDLVKYADMEQSYIDEYNKLKVQQSKESFQNDRPCNNQDAPVQEFFEINELKAQLQKKNTTISNLKDHIAKLKEISVSDCTAPVNSSTVIALGMFKLYLPPLSPKLRKNKKAYVDYLKQTKEHADTLHEIVEQVRALKPLDNSLDYACKFTTRIQELLVYVSATCPSSRIKSEKLVVVTPMNKNNKLGIKSSTDESRSKSRSNTRNNRISQTSRSNKKNKKIKNHPRNIKSSLSNTNRVHASNHDLYVVDYLNDVNSRTRAKSVKSNKKDEWKPIEYLKDLEDVWIMAPLRAFGEPFMRYSLPCKVDGQGAWDAELDLTDSANYVTEKVLDSMGFVDADFVVLDYANEREPSIMFGRDFLATTKSQVDFGLGEIKMNLNMFEEVNSVVDLLEEIGCSSEEVFKMGKANRNKGNYVLPVKINGVVEIVTLVDIRASVSVLPYSLYKDLGLGSKKWYQAYCGDLQVWILAVDPELYHLQFGPTFFKELAVQVIDMGRCNFDMGRDKDGNAKYGPVAPSFLDIKDDMERALAMEALKKKLRKIKTPTRALGRDGRTRRRIKTPKKLLLKSETDKGTTPIWTAGGDGDVFVDYSWERALSIDDEVYLEWVLEFFSTMYFDKDVDKSNLMKEKCIWFRLCGNEHILTLLEFVVVLGLFMEDELAEELDEKNQCLLKETGIPTLAGIGSSEQRQELRDGKTFGGNTIGYAIGRSSGWKYLDLMMRIWTVDCN